MKKNQPSILHHEADFIVVLKPAAMLSIPDRFDAEKPCLSEWLKKHLNQAVFTVHRLDFMTSGIMVFALNAESHRHLNTQFQKGEIKKNYLAIVEGKPEETRTIDLSIRESKSKKGLMETHIEGKKAYTSFVKLEQFTQLALLDVCIKTGRTHQIRVHLSSIGYPILADEQYGSGKVITLKNLKPKFTGEANPIIKTMALQAHTISFLHPTSNEEVHFEAPISKDFSVCLKLLRQWAQGN